MKLAFPLHPRRKENQTPRIERQYASVALLQHITQAIGA
jgi:hypothetical protein